MNTSSFLIADIQFVKEIFSGQWNMARNIFICGDNQYGHLIINKITVGLPMTVKEVKSEDLCNLMAFVSYLQVVESRAYKLSDGEQDLCLVFPRESWHYFFSTRNTCCRKDFYKNKETLKEIQRLIRSISMMGRRGRMSIVAIGEAYTFDDLCDFPYIVTDTNKFCECPASIQRFWLILEKKHAYCFLEDLTGVFEKLYVFAYRVGNAAYRFKQSFDRFKQSYQSYANSSHREQVAMLSHLFDKNYKRFKY